MRDAKDTLVGTDPRVSTTIKKKVPSHIVRKAILSANGNELSITEALDSRGLSGDPKRIWSLVVNLSDEVMSEGFLTRKIPEMPVAIQVDSLVRANPHTSAAIIKYADNL